MAIAPYNTQVKNVDGGICSIVGTVASKSLTILFSTSEKETNEFEVQPLVLKHMQDHINIVIRFIRRLKMQINYDEVLDEILCSAFI